MLDKQNGSNCHLIIIRNMKIVLELHVQKTSLEEAEVKVFGGRRVGLPGTDSSRADGGLPREEGNGGNK